MARTLMDIVGEDFRLEDEHDSYNAALEQVVAARLEGIEPSRRPGPAEGGPMDLMAALEASVQAAQSRRADRHEGDRQAARRRSSGETTEDPPT
ncbi:hypothetical protein ACWDFH_27480 [Streptomyces kronopolitis]